MEAVLTRASVSVSDVGLDLLAAWCAALDQGLSSTAADQSRSTRHAASDLETLIHRHRGPLQRLCFFRERNESRRQDLWQDILLALWRALPHYRCEASERVWVLRIAHNVAASHVARALRERRADDAAEQTGASMVDDPEQDIRIRELIRLVRQLDLPSQQLVLLYVEGLTSSEIAQATGLSPTNVTSKLSRIRLRLADQETTK